MICGKREGAYKRFPELLKHKQNDLIALFPGMLYNEPLSNHTSFRIGGPADVFVLPKTGAELIDVYNKCMSYEIPFTVMGDGTNILVLDDGIRGVVASTKQMDSLEIAEGLVCAGAGVRLARLSEEACRNSLEGLEFASGIPGTVGGAVYMNAGAYGGEIGDFVVSVTVYYKEEKNLSKNHMEFGYRSSSLQGQNAIILNVKLLLDAGSPGSIRKKMNELNKRRQETQPLDSPSAGSTFKRPPGGFAAELIDKSGLKGFAVGGAKVSEKHAGFIINTGGAKAEDVIRLMEIVKEKVFAYSGVLLSPEIRILGG